MYTTGVYLSALFKSAFESNKYTKITLPNKKIAQIKIKNFKKTKQSIVISAIKAKNRDIDVTIGAKISLTLSKKIKPNLIYQRQKPTILRIKRYKLSIFASNGVGVVTKDGLKIEKGYPAINPTPLDMIKNAIKYKIKSNLYAYVSVKNGKKIAQKTANPKIGVIGGISILGTSGIVKPLSNEAYIESIKAEVDVIDNYFEEIVLTLGESAFKMAQQKYKKEQIVEIGNFIYDSIDYINSKKSIKKITFITAIAKMTKVAQGFKNTHNRYGFINFIELKNRYKLDIEIANISTLKAILNQLSTQKQNELKSKITLDSKNILENWSNKDIDVYLS